MPLGRQAKVVTPKQQNLVLQHVAGSRHSARDRVMVLLSFRAGLRAKEIASLTWSMVTDAHGDIADEVALEDRASKGRGGRRVPMHKSLQDALRALQSDRGSQANPDYPVIYSERGRGMSAATVTNWFARLYATMGLTGCSSHSGRRTFITNAARKIVQAGGSLRDVQQLAGHRNLNTTMGYIGRGVPKDAVAACAWFSVAAAQGDKNAAKNKDRICPLMTVEQIAQAQKLSNEWLAKNPKRMGQ